VEKDIILFVNAIRPTTFAAFSKFKGETGRTFKFIVLVDEKIQESIAICNGQHELPEPIEVISADFDKPESIRRVLKPLESRLFAVTSQYENCLLELQKLIPYLPYMHLPTESSLEWASEKRLMRELLQAHNPSLVPAYLEVTDISDESLDSVERLMQYPVIVKPSGLEGSLLVSLAENRKELGVALKHIFDEIQAGYNLWIKRQRPAVLVEEFMQGDMYSIDSYVAADGTCRHTPPVKVITGRQVGFDDFFGYARLIPAGLSDTEIANAYTAAEGACHALGLRSVTGHVELMHTANGWKIIELGARIGGYRHDLYLRGYGINHIVNDIRNRAGEIPEIPTKLIAHTVVMQIYAPKEGVLTATGGEAAVHKLPSLFAMRQLCKVGDTVAFAKNNGDPVFEVMLSHSSEDQLQHDITAVEKAFSFTVQAQTEVLTPA